MRPGASDLQDYDDRSEEIVVPLTPQDVRDKLFTPVRFRPGYDEDEVDAFLDEVESELARLHGELARLHAECDRLGRGAAVSPGDGFGELADDDRVSALQAAADERVRSAVAAAEERAAAEIAALRAQLQAPPDARDAEVASEARQAQDVFQVQLQRAAEEVARAQQETVAARQQATEAQAEVARLRGSGGAPSEAQPLAPSVSEETLRRTLVLAQRTADAAVAEARSEAGEIVSAAEVEAEEAAAHGRAEQEGMLAKLEELRSFEHDYRSRLRAYLHLQLRDLEAGAPEPSQPLGGRQTVAIGVGAPLDAEESAEDGARSPAEPSADDPSLRAVQHSPDDTWNEYGQPGEWGDDR